MTRFSYLLLFSAALFHCQVFGHRRLRRVVSPSVTTESPVVPKPDIRQLHVTSHIQSRFATTQVTSRVVNPSNVPQEATFNVQLPESAFISNFTMEIDGEIIVGDVKEKEKAKKQFDAAKARGESAGLVAQNPRDTSNFQISVNVAPAGKVAFNLTYQEVLQRVHGVYKHVVNINPGQIIDDMRVDVLIGEKGQLNQVLVPEMKQKLGEKTNKELLLLPPDKLATIARRTAQSGASEAVVTFAPDREEQKSMFDDGKMGVQMVVLYGVEEPKEGSTVQVVNGYFVHFFSPPDLEIGSKKVVFVLDKSGSMSGDKIDQLKDAMKVILEDLRDTDSFGIVSFSDRVDRWNPELMTATADAKARAIEHVSGIVARGSTNIHDAMNESISMLKELEETDALAQMIVFLTDGQATAGITSSGAILDAVNGWTNDTDIHIHSISFGRGADFDLLRRVSSQNRGLARKVYEDSDAALQLQGFYDEISSPLLSDLDISYLNESLSVDSVVASTAGRTLYKGGEVVTVGRIHPAAEASDLQLRGVVKGLSNDRSIRRFVVDTPVRCTDLCPMPRCAPVTDLLRPPTTPHCIVPHCRRRCPILPELPDPSPLPADTLGGFVERMWAYMTIKHKLYKSKYGGVSKEMAKELKEEALELSLKYNFVTELTSMVVTKPSENATVVDEEQTRPQQTSHRFAASNSYAQQAYALPGPSMAMDLGAMRHKNTRPVPPPPPRPPMPTHAAPVSTTTFSAAFSFLRRPNTLAQTDAPLATIPAPDVAACAQLCGAHADCSYAVFERPNVCALFNATVPLLTCADASATVAEVDQADQVLIYCIKQN